MTFIELLAIAVALAMDAFAVAVCAGCAVGRARPRHYVRLCGAFGLFQAFMPILGWTMGRTVRPYIENWDHWVAFALLAWVGIAMIRESRGEEACATTDPTAGRQLVVLAVATSIDALAVGLSFSMLGVDIWQPALIIGLVCATITGIGLSLGNALARAALFGRRATLAGGIVLLLIGLRILYEHNVFS